MFEAFTERARKVMALANQEAQRFGDAFVLPEHILLGLIAETTGVAANVLNNLGLDLAAVRREVLRRRESGGEAVGMEKLPQAPRTKRVIEYAIEGARDLNHNHVGTEHLLLGLLREEDGAAAMMLKNLDIRPEELRAEVLSALGVADVSAESPRKGEGMDDDGIADPRVAHLLAKVAALREEKDEAVGKADYERAAKVRDEIEAIEAQIRSIRADSELRG